MKIADHRPNACKGRRMEYRPPGRTGIEEGDPPLDHERQGRR
jgi:hypothetical protein